MIRTMEAADLPAVHTLWNRTTLSREVLYKPLACERFQALFVSAGDHEVKCNVVAEQDGQILGFGSAYHNTGTDRGYITFILVDPAHRRRGVGTALLRALEHRLRAFPTIVRIDLNFFNPINLEWFIPGTPGHDHPNAPGVDVSSPAFPFFTARGYAETSRQYSYYRLLADFQFQPKIAERAAALAAQGISITYYDPARHYGLSELFDDLGNEDWRDKVMTNVNGPRPYPLLIVEQGGRVGGFAGPLYVQESGRGYFAGIGVHSELRGVGAGSVLFSALCQGLRDIGATFMSLFTGRENVARKIYESAGFQVVHEWACMRKAMQ
ncbi:GNAT family N-acetyltransferase [Symbiobacterium thermophilum]|uniref:Putative acetyltransferase n=1 Tax=Symbiobacterium thermophilum (strain DSM 24528 / JCM 14929 / IAM 14863 / T) TaxID=292459 RepID=Q67SR4_SYMTH|nr:GNAT family N-acetyltransferase [Symbiobacterium thermophilum]BAD39279.1 putative acetyltransferase [Symbiobacterium thermophilum IAM 14863]